MADPPRHEARVQHQHARLATASRHSLPRADRQARHCGSAPKAQGFIQSIAVPGTRHRHLPSQMGGTTHSIRLRLAHVHGASEVLRGGSNKGCDCIGGHTGHSCGGLLAPSGITDGARGSRRWRRCQTATPLPVSLLGLGPGFTQKAHDPGGLLFRIPFHLLCDTTAWPNVPAVSAVGAQKLVRGALGALPHKILG